MTVERGLGFRSTAVLVGGMALLAALAIGGVRVVLANRRAKLEAKLDQLRIGVPMDRVSALLGAANEVLRTDDTLRKHASKERLVCRAFGDGRIDLGRTFATAGPTYTYRDLPVPTNGVVVFLLWPKGRVLAYNSPAEAVERLFVCTD